VGSKDDGLQRGSSVRVRSVRSGGDRLGAERYWYGGGDCSGKYGSGGRLCNGSVGMVAAIEAPFPTASGKHAKGTGPTDRCFGLDGSNGATVETVDRRTASNSGRRAAEKKPMNRKSVVFVTLTIRCLESEQVRTKANAWEPPSLFFNQSIGFGFGGPTSFWSALSWVRPSWVYMLNLNSNCIYGTVENSYSRLTTYLSIPRLGPNGAELGSTRRSKSNQRGWNMGA